jgi:hypothetical protein
MAMRVATSGKFNDTYSDIRNVWSIEDLFQAIEMLDILSSLEKASMPESNT